MLNQTLLVSFCNLPAPSQHPVLCVKPSFDWRKPHTFIPLSLGRFGAVPSASGVVLYEEFVFILFRLDLDFHIAVLKCSDLSPLSAQALPEIKDGHSILVAGRAMYVVSTGTDEILRYDLKGHRLENPEIVWRASRSGSDTHHVNSIVECGGELYVTAFGEKTGELWSSATNGYIHNISRDIRVKEGVYHPHSLSERGGRLYYCDSSRKAFCSLDDVLFEVDGYARGTAWLSDDRVCVGSSIGRRISKSTGLVANPADPGKSAGKSKIAIWDLNLNKYLADIDLSRFGPEIYDVVPFEQEMDLSKFARLSRW